MSKQKRSSSNSLSSSSSSSDLDQAFIGLIFRLFYIAGEGIYYLQEGALESYQDHPSMISLEGNIHGGYFHQYEGTMFTPMIRGNLGIFSTEFRYQNIRDITGPISTYDWQILKVNVPIYPVIFSMGTGYSKIVEADLSLFEYSFSAKGRFYRNKMVGESTYRVSRFLGSAFRKEFKATLDYEIKAYPVKGSVAFRVCPTIGFVYQNYLSRFEQYYIMGGVNFRFF
ncbi:MAG: hypothetical protein ACK40G_05235 [Cytophagaceae bacterium]